MLSSLLVDKPSCFLDTMDHKRNTAGCEPSTPEKPGEHTERKEQDMPKKLYPTNVLEQAQSVVSAWNQISPSLAFGSITPATLTADITSATSIESQMATMEAQMTNLRNQRDALYVGMWDKVKRVRSGVKANYGDDSSQYEMVGGTRLSERKSPARRITVAA